MSKCNMHISIGKSMFFFRIQYFLGCGGMSGLNAFVLGYFYRLKARLQLNIVFTLRRVLAMFTCLAITSPKVN